jgi:murein endopeptidase
MNGDRRHERLKIGDKIKLLIEGNPSRSEALGRPMSGRLKNGEQLKSGPGYHRRRPQRSWGTNETITHLLSAVAAVRARYPRVHDVAIGDISAKRGGKLHPHISHQSGRDVDIGYYFRKQKREGPKAFISALHADIDYPATWKLITSLVGRRKRSTPIQYIFMNYSVQRLIYKWARRKGISKRKLDWMFQYPHGRRAMHGIIRHSKGHHAHMHVRFRCPASDSGCKG